MTKPQIDTALFSVSAENFTITAQLQRITSDILIVLAGGNIPHIGSVTTLSHGKIESTVFICHNGKAHKDHILAEKIMTIIQPFITGNCVITSGIHVDYITKIQIMASLEMATNIAQQIISWLQNNPVIDIDPIYQS